MNRRTRIALWIGIPIGGLLPLLAIELDRIAPDATKTAPAVKRLQTALNGLGQADADDRTPPPLVIDGLLGPKTAARAQQAVARGGTDGIIDAFRRIREDDRLIA